MWNLSGVCAFLCSEGTSAAMFMTKRRPGLGIWVFCCSTVAVTLHIAGWNKDAPVRCACMWVYLFACEYARTCICTSRVTQITQVTCDMPEQPHGHCYVLYDRPDYTPMSSVSVRVYYGAYLQKYRYQRIWIGMAHIYKKARKQTKGQRSLRCLFSTSDCVAAALCDRRRRHLRCHHHHYRHRKCHHVTLAA